MKIFKASENIYRGPRPKSFFDLKPYGIKYVFNLQSGAYEKFTDSDYEFEDARDFGMREFMFQMGDIIPASALILRKIIAELVYFSKDVGSKALDGNCYIHCLHGKDRTGMVVAAYRILEQGWSYKRAFREMDEYGFHNFPYFWWKRQLKKLDRP